MSLLKRYRPTERRSCWWCGGDFTPRFNDTVYCKASCGDAHRATMVRFPGKDSREEARR